MIFSEAGGDTKEEESPSVYRTNQQVQPLLLWPEDV
jgi:hypothetical protein